MKRYFMNISKNVKVRLMGKTIFTDKNGREWDEENLNELIETLTTLNKSLERISYYR